MPTEAFRRSVTTSATEIYTHPATSASSEGDHGAKKVTIINNTATQGELILGPAGLTAGNGARVPATAPRVLDFELEPGEALYGIVAVTTQAVDVLVNGR